MKKSVKVLVATVVLSIFAATAPIVVTDAGQAHAWSIKKAWKKTKNKAKSAAKSVAKTTKKAAKATAKGAKYVGKKTAQGAKYVGKKTAQGAKATWKYTKKGASYAARKTVQLAKWTAGYAVAAYDVAKGPIKMAANRAIDGALAEANSYISMAKGLAKLRNPKKFIKDTVNQVINEVMDDSVKEAFSLVREKQIQGDFTTYLKSMLKKRMNSMIADGLEAIIKNSVTAALKQAITFPTPSAIARKVKTAVYESIIGAVKENLKGAVMDALKEAGRRVVGTPVRKPAPDPVLSSPAVSAANVARGKKYYNYAIKYYKRNSYTSALAYINYAVKYDPNNSTYKSWKRIIESKAGKTSSSTTTSASSKKSAATYFQSAVKLYNKGNYRSALVYIDYSLKYDPNNSVYKTWKTAIMRNLKTTR